MNGNKEREKEKKKKKEKSIREKGKRIMREKKKKKKGKLGFGMNGDVLLRLGLWLTQRADNRRPKKPKGAETHNRKREAV